MTPDTKTSPKPLPPTWFMLSLIVMAVLHFLLPLATLIPGPVRWLAVVPFAFGAWLNLDADARFKRLETTVKPGLDAAVLVDGGPFALSRHPMYLGMVAILAAAAVLSGRAAPWIGPVGFAVLMDRRFIPMEEASMRRVFGDRYDGYARRVRRWI